MNSIFRLIVRKFHVSITIFGLTIGLLVLIPKAAQAATSVALDTTNDFVKVATVYKTQPNNQTEVLSQVLEFEESTLPHTPGFINSSILKGQEGTEVVTLTQWQDLPSFKAYAQEYSNEQLDTAKPQTFVFEVQKAETRGLKPAIAESGAIMFSQFKMKDPQKQSELASIIEQVMPTAFATVPGLQWAAMSPSTDQSTIAMIAQWNSRQDFESLGQNAGFDQETNYWDSYADNEHDIFDVLKIIK